MSLKSNRMELTKSKIRGVPMNFLTCTGMS